MADRVVAGARRGRTGALDPLGHHGRPVALDAAAHESLDVGAAARVEPHDARSRRHAVAVDGHRRGPLARDRHGDDLASGHVVACEQACCRRHDQGPPALGVLGGCTARAAVRPKAVELGGDDVAFERDEPDLEAARAEVDREAQLGRRRHDTGRDVWASIIFAIADRMNSSAAGVGPPGTPP